MTLQQAEEEIHFIYYFNYIFISYNLHQDFHTRASKKLDNNKKEQTLISLLLLFMDFLFAFYAFNVLV